MPSAFGGDGAPFGLILFVLFRYYYILRALRTSVGCFAPFFVTLSCFGLHLRRITHDVFTHSLSVMDICATVTWSSFVLDYSRRVYVLTISDGYLRNSDLSLVELL